MRIQNIDTLVSHGNVSDRKAVVEVLEAGLVAADPYYHTKQLLRIENGKLILDGKDYEPYDDPRSGLAVFDLDELDDVYVLGAGKGIQRAAKAIEEVLGDKLTAGHVIAKHGDPKILKRIEVTEGAHPVPDEGCVRGCQRILELTKRVKKGDLVFFVIANGVSSLLTLPVPSVTLEDVRKTTYMMQIDRGAPTGDLNAIRNHLDVLKAGRMARLCAPATMVHIICFYRSNYKDLMTRNVWLHSLPDSTTFADAQAMLKRWKAWDEVPHSVRDFIGRADPKWETVKRNEYERMAFRIFHVNPRELGHIKMASKKAMELGLYPVVLTEGLSAEAKEVGKVLAALARQIESHEEPFKPPCILLSGGEMIVTVGRETGIGGRNQECVLSTALRIAGSKRITIGSVDTDGTDGPGTQFVGGAEKICLAGAIADGYTLERARNANIDLVEELNRHNSTIPLLKLDDGIKAEQGISMNDITVVLISRNK